MRYRKMNLFERKGLVKVLDEFLDIKIDHIICGTCEHGAINIQNTLEINAPNEEYPLISKAGLTEADDILLEFYNEDESQTVTFWGSYPAFKWREVDEDNHNDYQFRHTD